MSRLVVVRCTARANIEENWLLEVPDDWIDADGNLTVDYITVDEMLQSPDSGAYLINDRVTGEEEDRSVCGHSIDIERFTINPREKVVKVCPKCGGDNVWKDAVAHWCADTQQWVLAGVQDHEGCNDCDHEGDEICESKEMAS